MNDPVLESPSTLEMAWLQVRMAWQSVKNTRLDQEKKDVIAILIRHYSETGQPDRLQSEFEQVLLRLEEEHELRVKELGREGRRVAKQVNNIIQVIQDTNESRMQHCRDKVEETPSIIAEWKAVIDLLFRRADSDPEALKKEGT
jgi:DNA integrity scanning protein DisA with diadenylate cyclase activity